MHSHPIATPTCSAATKSPYMCKSFGVGTSRESYTTVTLRSINHLNCVGLSNPWILLWKWSSVNRPYLMALSSLCWTLAVFFSGIILHPRITRNKFSSCIVQLYVYLRNSIKRGWFFLSFFLVLFKFIYFLIEIKFDKR